MKYPRPYKLQWLNDCGEVKVNKKVRVSFSIGRNKDEVLCDVVPMHVGHILLGRPWQFDRKVNHDEFKNRHSFVKDNKTINLVPLTPRQVYKDQMILNRENELKKKIVRSRVQKKMMKKRVKGKKRLNRKKRVKRKKRLKRKDRVKKMREKQKNKLVFMLRRVMSRVLLIQTSLYLYSYTKRYVLILTNLTNFCLVLLSLCCKNMRMCFLTMCLVDFHLLEE